MGENNSMLLTGSLYDRIKNLVLIVLPAISTLYFTLGTIWGLPAVEQVVGTLAAIAAFLGALIGLSKRSYDNSDAKYDGTVVVDSSDPTKDTVSIQPFFNEDPRDTLATKSELRLKLMPPAEK